MGSGWLLTFWRSRFFDDWRRMSASTSSSPSSAKAARGRAGGSGRDDEEAAGFLRTCSPNLCIPASVANCGFDAEQTLACEFLFRPNCCSSAGEPRRDKDQARWKITLPWTGSGEPGNRIPRLRIGKTGYILFLLFLLNIKELEIKLQGKII